MSNRYAAGKHAIAECDRCGFRYKLSELKPLTDNDKPINFLVCTSCWEEEHPQRDLGKYPVEDPQAVRNPRPDTSYAQSRSIQWGWNPVGFMDNGLTPNDLLGQGSVGNVTVTVS